MRDGYERDKSVYVFAASFNSNIIANRKLRKLYEEEQLGDYASELYLKHFAALKKTRPYIGEPFSDQLREAARAGDPNTDRIERIEAATVALQSEIVHWSSQFRTFKGYALAIAIGLVIAYWIRK
jgi:hypothetical protein